MEDEARDTTTMDQSILGVVRQRSRTALDELLAEEAHEEELREAETTDIPLELEISIPNNEETTSSGKPEEDDFDILELVQQRIQTHRAHDRSNDLTKTEDDLTKEKTKLTEDDLGKEKTKLMNGNDQAMKAGSATFVRITREKEDTSSQEYRSDPLIETMHPAETPLQEAAARPTALVDATSMAFLSLPGETSLTRLNSLAFMEGSRLSLPGATYITPSSSLAFLGEDSSESASSQSRNAVSTEDNSSQAVPVAAMVGDEESPEDLQQAENFEEGATAREQKTRQFKTAVLILIALAIVVISTVVAVLVPTKESSTQDNNLASPSAGAPTPSPSQDSTTQDGYLLTLFPEETIDAIMDPRGESPQSRAFQWLMEDTKESLLDFSEDRIKQRFALATLYHATEGKEWLENSNWVNHNSHECEWYRRPAFANKMVFSKIYPGYISNLFPSSEPLPPTCDENGLYLNLWLDQNDLAGTLPDELYLLTSLQTLSMGMNKLQGTISSHIGHLTALTGLGIFINVQMLGSSIPSEIALLTDLRALLLSRNNHQGTYPSELWALDKLEYLALGQNPQLGGTIPTEVGTFSNLRWLHWNKCNLTGTIPTEIGLIGPLEQLSLFESKLSGTVPGQVGQLSATILQSYDDGSRALFIYLYC